MDHYRAYLAALSAYESFIRADPDLLAQSDHGRALKAAADAAWHRYYAAGWRPSASHGDLCPGCAKEKAK